MPFRGRERIGGRVSGQDDGVAGFAALLRELKERTDRSYGSLARRLQMNTSTLHRYCAGDAVPQDFAPVERFAALCGATPEERVELHRRWLTAVEARRRPRTQAGPEPVEAPPAHPAPAAPPAPGPDAEPAAGPEPAAAPWYRRRRPAVALAVGCAALAAAGSLAALPTGRDSSAGAAPSARTAAAAPATGTPSGPPPRTPSASPDAAAAAPVPSPVATSPSPAASRTRAPAPTEAAVPLAWTADSQVWEHGCGHDYVIGRPPARVPPPPAPQDAGAWAAAQGAVHGGETTVRISVQGRSATAVVLEALRVRVAGRAEPARGHVYAMDEGCGGALTPRHFAVDLDRDRPLARPVAGNDAGTPIPAVRMPYRVSAEDPEVLLVTARTAGCDCRWWLELDWSSQGRTGTVRIDDRGRPFRTSAVQGLPRHSYDTSARRWTQEEE
ncbi:helix-turn-helix transcriptional regulator [Streptomyces glaucescens]|uniref:helix-turn-helix domain-containing protein n=1 Tax=Streptomyces glaucescens TaxID=1907 RepID=UPI00344EAF9E